MSCSTLTDLCDFQACAAEFPDFCSWPGIPVPCRTCGLSLNDELNVESNTGLLTSKLDGQMDWYLLFCIAIVMIIFIGIAIIGACRRCIDGNDNYNIEKQNDIESQANYRTFTNVQSN